MRLGIIVRADKTGLGNQTRDLCRMLNPSKVLIIDSTPFNKNTQYFDTYKDYNVQISRGFPDDRAVKLFLRDIDAVLTCELFYSNRLVDMANVRGIRTYNQYNYEFLDHLVNPNLTLPTKLLSPSYWHLSEMREKYGDRVQYLPPPTITSSYESVREENFNLGNKPRFLHSVGRLAVNDRNGTLDLIKALVWTKADFELVLKVQTSDVDLSQYGNDPRITFDYSSPDDETQLYKGFHALILPRRYAGLCLPMNEALMSGVPVIMTDVEPNNDVLPKKWLVESTLQGSFRTRTEIPYYSADPVLLAKKIDWLCDKITSNKFHKEQEEAFGIAYTNYSPEMLLDKYKEIIV